MSDDYQENRRKYIADFKETVDRHGNRAFEYEQKAIEFANNALRALTYLNGGALIALPTAIALFRGNPTTIKVSLVSAAACFVAGLIFVVVSQGAAFFTMARRSEGQSALEHEQSVNLIATYFPESPDKHAELLATGRSQHALADKKIRYSNQWRLIGLIFVWLSLLAFVVGCFLGASAILSPA